MGTVAEREQPVLSGSPRDARLSGRLPPGQAQTRGQAVLLQGTPQSHHFFLLLLLLFSSIDRVPRSQRRPQAVESKVVVLGTNYNLIRSSSNFIIVETWTGSCIVVPLMTWAHTQGRSLTCFLT